MTEPYTNTRPMPNHRRLISWCVGIGCAFIWLIGPVLCLLVISFVEFIPVEFRQQVVQNVKSIPVWLWLILAFFIVTGFVAGRDLVNWLYKE